MVSVVGFERNGETYALCSFPSGLCAFDHLTLRNWDATGLEQGFGEVFVAGNFFGNRTGLVRLRGPNSPLCAAITELHQVAFGQANMGNLSVRGGVHNVGGTGAQTQRIHHVSQMRLGRLEIKRRVIDRCKEQIATGLKRRPPDLFLAGAKGHFVDAALRGLAGFTETGLHTR